MEEKTDARFNALEAKTDAKFNAVDARFNALEEKTDTRFNALEAKTDAKFDKLTASVVELQRDVEGVKHDIAGLYHWDYWLLTVIIAVIAMPQIITGIREFFRAVADGIAVVIGAFRKT